MTTQGGTSELLNVTIPRALDLGTYDIAVTDSAGATGLLENAFEIVPNRIPRADAGLDRVLACQGASGTTAGLDGSASSDADSTPGTNDDITAFSWSEGAAVLASTSTASAPFAVGSHDVRLTVTDQGGATSSDELQITIQDTQPPSLSVVAPKAGACLGPSALPFVVTDDFTDACDPTIRRSYDPPTGPSYSAHGDHEVIVTATDTSGNGTSATSRFTMWPS